jgi:glycosyltransferase involved in cell wall biosynthesis
MKLTLLIPAYNEEERIRDTLQQYAEALRTRDAELVVVVNGSRDGTEALIRDNFLTQWPQLRLVVIPEKVGKGGAIMRGLAEAKGDMIAFTDADGSTPPASLLDLVDSLPGNGICIGSRWLPDSVIGRPQPLARRVASRLFHVGVRVLFGLRVSDTQCGAKVMTREVKETLLPNLGCTQWAFDVELLFLARRAGFSIAEKPIEWNDVSGSKVKILRCSAEMTAALIRLRLLYSPFRGMVHQWDNTLGRRLFQRRLQRMAAIYRGSPHE